MVTLAKHASFALYLPDPTNPGAAGLAFLPEQEDAAPPLELDAASARMGFFVVWTGGIPTDIDLARYESALQAAREEASSDRRVVFQFFHSARSDFVAETIVAEGEIPILLGKYLEPSSLGVTLKAAFTLSLANCGLEVAGDNLVFVPSNPAGGHTLVHGSGDLVLDGLRMPILGPLAGAFVGGTGVSPENLVGNDFVSDFTKRGKLKADGTGKKFYQFRSERRPLILGAGPGGAAAVALDVAFDPLDALNPERTFFRPAAGQTLVSGFRTTHGHKVLLTSSTAEAAMPPRFAYVRRRARETEAGAVQFSRINLLLEGDFDVALADDDDQAAAFPDDGFGIVVADTQHEYLEAPRSEAAGDAPLMMSFRRGAAHFKEIAGDAAATTDEDILIAENGTSDQTSWAKLSRRNTAGAVVSEARDLRRLVAGEAADASAAELRHDPFRLERRQAGLSNKPDGYVPVLPRPTSDDTLSDKTDAPAEASLSALLSGQRRRLLDLASRSDAAAAPAPSTTPLGFEVVEDADGITKIVLARTTGGVEAAELTITDREGGPIAGPIVNALIRNQLFLVVNCPGGGAEPSPERDFLIKGTLRLSDWGFRFDFRDLWKSAQEAKDGTPVLPLLIVKGFEGLSIKDLIGKPQLWSGTAYLRSLTGDSPAEYAEKEFIAALESAEKSGDPIYRPFLAAIADPSWTGVLVLDVPLSLGVLPTQVKGLLGGIDTARLKAHHFAVPVRRLEGAGNLSKPFAAIDYSAGEKAVDYDTTLKPDDFDGPKQAPNGSDDGSFGMKVDQLRVGFDNGALQSFFCQLKLTVGAFFHDTGITLRDPATNEEKADKTILLKGRWQRRMVDGNTFETYDFFTDTIFAIEMPQRFPLIDKATITRVSYVSEVAKLGTEDLVTSKFLIDGSMEFKKLAGGTGAFDFLDIKRSTFSGLSLDLRFLVPESGRVGLPKFRFSPGALIFDFDMSELKDGVRGFFGSLPIKFSGFGWLGDAVSLPKLGYFGLGKGTGGASPFFLKFDLDLGSLGSFASALSKFKMELAFAFGLDGANNVNWDLGFRFAGGNGKDLDIGLEGFLQFTCERYEVVTLKSEKTGGTYYGFRGVNARLVVLGHPLPPEEDNANIFLFVDPEKLGGSDGVGWFLAYQREPGDAIIDLRVLTLGQRVDPLRKLPGTMLKTRDVVAELARLAGGVTEEEGKPFKIPEVTFDPDRGWTIGFHAMIYRFIELGFALRDPDLAGVLLDVKLSEGSEQSLFSVDILYRKLTENLGVYSAEIVLPPELRNWQFGAAGITLPYIGVEIFTDGNWGIDLGYPANKDFSRSFALSIFPFVGAGGIYYRRVSGAAARLLPSRPTYLRDDGNLEGNPDSEIFRYDPVTEIGMGMRVGLGVTLAQGILNAGLSLTVYGYLEGGFGRLYNPDNKPTKAKGTYIVVHGAVGVMGELYGYVDFGIVKAGVFVQLYVEVGFELETDKATELYYEVGVRVSVRVVVGRIKIFGSSIEIAISFSFDTTVRFSQRLGRTENQEYYRVAEGLAIAGEPGALREVLDWSLIPSPQQWAELPGRIALEVAIQPDVTVAPGAAGHEAHAVFLMAAELGEGAAPSPVERLVEGLTAWALCAGIDDLRPATLRTGTVTAEQLRGLARRLADPRAGKPGYAEIAAFLRAGFAGAVLALKPGDEPQEGAPVKGVVLPMPDAMLIRRIRPGEGGDEEQIEDIRLADYRFVDDRYRQELAAAFERFMLSRSQATAGKDMLAAEGQSLVSALFEEWAAMIMRAAVQRLAALAEAKGAQTQPVADLLAALVARKDAASDRDLPSVAAEVAVSTGRFFTYGQRLPHPAHADAATLPAWLEPLGRDSGPAVDPDKRFFHAMLRLAGQQVPVGDALRFEVPAGTYDGWLEAPEDIAVEVLDGTAETVLATAASLALPGSVELGALSKRRRRYVALGSHAAASRLNHEADELRLWAFGNEARTVVSTAAAPLLFGADPADPQKRDFAALTQEERDRLRPAIVIDVGLRRPPERTDVAAAPEAVADAFEIRAIPEPLRNLIDPFAPAIDGGMSAPPGIEWIGLYRHDPETGELVAVGVQDGAIPTVVQSNLSVEPKPDSEAAAAEERIEPVADTSDPLAFVQLLRQAAIVNTGGYHLTYKGAAAELRPLFEPAAGGQKPLSGGGWLRVVIALADLDSGLPFANALLSPADFRPGSVLATGAGDTADPLHEPGVVPLVIRRTDKAASDSVEDELGQRFSNLALEIEVRDAAGKPFGTPQYLDQSVPTGPDFPELDDAGKPIAVAEGDYVYRVSVPVRKIAGLEATEVYDLVGGSMRVKAAWRDIYGNGWREPFADTGIDLVYNDRLLGLTGLPYVKMAYWPDTKPRGLKLGLRSDYEPLLRLDGLDLPDGEPVPAQWATAMRDELGRCVAMLRRAAAQLGDARVAVSLNSTLGNAVPLDKTPVRRHLDGTADNLDKLAADIGAASGEKTRRELRESLKAWIDGQDHGLVIPVVFDGASSGLDFAEFQVSVAIERPVPADNPGLYPKELTDDGAEAAANAGLSDICKVVEAVSPNLRGKALKAEELKPTERDLGHGDAEDLIKALAAIATDHRIASGYGETAGVTEKALWLIRSGYFDGLADGSLYGEEPPVALALPPLKTEAYSRSFTDLKAPDGSERRREIRDADADAYGREALALLERLLSPAITVPLLNAADAGKRTQTREAIKQLLDAKEGLAGSLAERLAVAFDRDVARYEGMAKERRDRIVEAVADALKRDLRSHYKITSLLAYFDRRAHEVPLANRVGHGVAVHSEKGIRIAVYNLPLPPDGGQVSRDLVLLCEAMPEPGQGNPRDHYAPPERLDLTHVQRLPNPEASKGIVHYRKTAWLRLHDPDAVAGAPSWASIPLPRDGATIPSPLRSLPRLPILENEGFGRDAYADTDDPATNLAAARKWTSRRDFAWEGKATDRLTVEVHYATRGESQALDAETEDLATRLVRFVLESENEIAKIAAGDHDAYAWVARRAWDRLLQPLAGPEKLDAPAGGPHDRITLREIEHDGAVKVEGSDIKLVSGAVAYGVRDDDAAPLVFIKDSSAAPRPLVGAEIGKEPKFRRLETRGLDIIDLASARTELSLTRNARIDFKDGDGTGHSEPLQKRFVYRLPTIGSGEPTVPALDVATTVTGGKFDPIGGIESIQKALETFFDGLLKPSGGSAPACSADVLFEYETGLFTAGGAPDASGEEGGPVIAVRSGITHADTVSVAKDLAGAIHDWFLKQHPAKRGGRPIGCVIADARVFATGDGEGGHKDRRILRLRRCRFDFQ
ncbi:hypothetical protein [Kumtagia ephedrae]|uniref:Peptidoglycan-binding protein n=1 Tax=Kumtagia ephedrae TaxID=2116701 RepID=A0A2P7SLE2_9HYPH|nr:hypothetical protein [Mesorhizobium ephedrae]PSJ63306.1 hypothetical protein C7I84_06620 [Mesorhizobium ephedrae]